MATLKAAPRAEPRALMAKARTETFRHWLRAMKVRSEGPLGDLVEDVIADREFPIRSKDGLATYEKYLRSKRACREAIRALRSAWARYQRELTRRAQAPCVLHEDCRANTALGVACAAERQGRRL